MGHFAVAASVQVNIESAAKVLMALCFSRVAFAQLFAEKCDAVEGTGGVMKSKEQRRQDKGMRQEGRLRNEQDRDNETKTKTKTKTKTTRQGQGQDEGMQ